jgi:endonuclease/exonuclease/phosphatase family metal-dependent hydrolase
MSKIIFITLLFFSISYPQQEIILMSYNILNYPGNDTTIRNPYFIEIFSTVNPDIIVVQEIQSQQGVDGFKSNVLLNQYEAGIFINGPDTDNAIFYKTDKFEFLSNKPIQTALRDISQFTLVYISTNDTLIIYSVHLKASSGSSNELQRAAEIDSLRKFTNTLHSGANFIVVGDFNIYRSGEPAYQKILDQTQSGYLIDPQPLSGTWNNSSYSQYHTQSPRTRAFGGGANGGMDDRFDMILFSQTVWDSGGIMYVQGSTIPYGNDGNHYNDSINRPPNTAVSQQIADALHYASDHLPVIVTLTFDNIVPVEIDLFTTLVNDNDITLNWSTFTETNNYGFEIQRISTYNNSWKNIAFIPGKGTSTKYQSYSYTDYDLPSGSYTYRYKQINTNGTFEYSPKISADILYPKKNILHQNYPNPFNPTTTIEFDVPYLSFITIKIFDVLGNEIEKLISDNFPPGQYSVVWNAAKYPSGVYFTQITFENNFLLNKMIYIK